MANGRRHNNTNNDICLRGRTLNKEEQKKLQSIFNEALKTILYLPNGTPTTILLNETGNYPIEYIIKKKQVLLAKRIDSMQNESLIKDVRCDMAFIEPMHRNKPNIIHLLIKDVTISKTMNG